MGVNFGRYALCDAIYTCFKTFQISEERTKKNMEGKLF